MLTFDRLNDKQVTLSELTAGLTVADLRALTHEMVDTMLALIAGCEDADVTFVPVDPEADDPYAETFEEATLAWNLGHVIVHTTASAEESAFLAAELARGVALHGRSRYEVPWQQITTIEQCQRRLDESRRMRLASLDLWPDPPHLEVTVTYGWSPDPVNAVGRFVRGLNHDHAHLGQLAEIARQARAARVPAKRRG